MKKTVTKILSILLALACLHGVVMSAFSISDLASVKEKWAAVESEQENNLDKLSQAIDDYKVKTLIAQENNADDPTSDNKDGGDTDTDKNTGDGKVTGDAAQNTGDGQKNQVISSAELTKQDGSKTYSDADRAEIDKYWAAYRSADEAVTKAKADFDAAEEALKNSKPEYDAAKEALDAAKAEKAAADAQLASSAAGYEEAQAEISSIGSTYTSAYPTYQKYLAYKALYDQDMANGLSVSVWEKPMNEQYVLLMLLTGGQPIEDIVARYNAAQSKISAYEAAQTRANNAQTALDNAQSRFDAAAPQYDVDKKAYDDAKAALALATSNRNAAQRKYEDAVKKADSNLAGGTGANTPVEVPSELPQIDIKDTSSEGISGALDTLLDSDTYTDAKGNKVLPSISDRLGDNFTYLVVNDNGEATIDAEKALLVVNSARDYLTESTAAAAKEFANLSTMSIIELLICIVGLFAALLGLLGKTKTSGIIAIAAAAAALCTIIAMNVNGNHEYPFTIAAGSQAAGNVFTSLAILAVAAIIHTVGAFIYTYMSKKAVTE